MRTANSAHLLPWLAGLMAVLLAVPASAVATPILTASVPPAAWPPPNLGANVGYSPDWTPDRSHPYIDFVPQTSWRLASVDLMTITDSMLAVELRDAATDAMLARSEAWRETRFHWPSPDSWTSYGFPNGVTIEAGHSYTLKMPLVGRVIMQWGIDGWSQPYQVPGHEIAFRAWAEPVPEPSTFLLATLAGIGLLALRHEVARG